MAFGGISAIDLAHWYFSWRQSEKLGDVAAKAAKVTENAVQQGTSFLKPHSDESVFLALMSHLHLVDVDGDPEKNAGRRQQKLQEGFKVITAHQKQFLVKAVIDFQLPERYEDVVVEIKESSGGNNQRAPGNQNNQNGQQARSTTRRTERRQMDYEITKDDQRLQMLAWLADMETTEFKTWVNSLVSELSSLQKGKKVLIENEEQLFRALAVWRLGSAYNDGLSIDEITSKLNRLNIVRAKQHERRMKETMFLGFIPMKPTDLKLWGFPINKYSIGMLVVLILLGIAMYIA